MVNLSILNSVLRNLPIQTPNMVYKTVFRKRIENAIQTVWLTAQFITLLHVLYFSIDTSLTYFSYKALWWMQKTGKYGLSYETLIPLLAGFGFFYIAHSITKACLKVVAHAYRSVITPSKVCNISHHRYLTGC